MTAQSETVRIGTRGSQLALRQTQEVIDLLQTLRPSVRFERAIISSGGDNKPDVPIDRLGLGAFVKELQAALLAGEIDVAVHSLKDLPTAPTPGLVVAAIPQREDPRDALVNRWGLTLDQLPEGARIGTGSPRRAAQLRHLRPDIRVLPIRGNVTTRLEKAQGNDYDGVVVALAGLRRLGLDGQVAQVLAPDDLVPAPGQGALALEVREEDTELIGLVRETQHHDTYAAVQAERAFLMALGGGCRAPFGAFATVEGNALTMVGMLAEVSGHELYKVTAAGSADDPEGVAQQVYRELEEQGATRLIAMAGDL